MKKSLWLISLVAASALGHGCKCCQKTESSAEKTQGTATPGQSGTGGSDRKEEKYTNPPPKHEMPKPGTPDEINKPPKKGDN